MLKYLSVDGEYNVKLDLKELGLETGGVRLRMWWRTTGFHGRREGGREFLPTEDLLAFQVGLSCMELS